MHIENFTDVQALLFLSGVIGFSILLYRFIPSGNTVPRKREYTWDEITQYDREIPIYFLAAALSLILGGMHTIVKNVPGFWEWLWQAGYGGHLFRDLSNSHIVIVGGGTIMLTALTWYILPRVTGRPLYSRTLAGASFWMTLIGLLGFYLAWLVLGLVEGQMVANGWDYLAAKDALGNWHKLPTAISASIMGMGYWTYVVNAFLTVFASRFVKDRPTGNLARFLLVAAGGLFIGTVQGVIQVLPANADWIRLAGKFGEFVDPISHAHVNLVTGTMVGLVGFFLYFNQRMRAKPVSKRAANLVFWTLVPGSLVFYLSFLLLGLILGNQVNGYGGIAAPQLAPFLGSHLYLILSIAGTAMLAGFWAYFLTLWRSLGLRDLIKKGTFWHEMKAASPRAFWLVSSFALVVGTFQGILQVIPATAQFLTVPSEVPNIHAQLNMIGGVILALIGLVYLLLPELAGHEVEKRMRQYSLLGIASGIGLYYVVTLVTGLLRLHWLQLGMTDGQAADQLGWAAPALLFLTAIPMLFGYLAFGNGLWKATREYRPAWVENVHKFAERYNGQPIPWKQRTSMVFFLLPELISAMVGFPGLGWLLAGKAWPGIPMLLGGQVIAWAVIPLLMDPFGAGPLAGYGLLPPVIYLSTTTMLSVSLLWLALRKQRRKRLVHMDEPLAVTK